MADSYPPNLSGAAVAATRLESMLVTAGIEVGLAHPGECWRHGADRREWHLPVPSVRPRIPGLDQRYANPRFVRRIGDWLDTLSPDVVHVNSHLLLGRQAIAWAKERGVPCVATSHLMAANITGTHPALRLAAPLVGRSLDAGVRSSFGDVSLLTAPSRFAAGEARRVVDRPVRVVSNGVDTDLFVPAPARRRDPRGGVRLLYVGRLQREKRVADLLRAVAHASESVRSLVIVGSGPQQRRLRNLVGRLGLRDRVELRGRVGQRELLRLYQDSDVFCMPSPVELQCLAVLEAQACGLPTVAADAGALPELVEPGHTGLLFRPGDARGLADCIDALAGDPSLAEAYGQAARSQVSAHSLSQVGRLLAGLYEQVGSLVAAGERSRHDGQPGVDDHRALGAWADLGGSPRRTLGARSRLGAGGQPTGPTHSPGPADG